MAKGDISSYKGTDYGLDPYLDMSFNSPAPSFGLSVDARTANQLKEISTKLNTGATTIEASFLMPEVAESIPEQHLKEINRLRKIVGADLTLHGTLVEPTGVSKQGWVESDREAAERQMTMSMLRGHELNPDGNVIVTFHASNGLPSPETKVFNEKTGKEELKEFWAVDTKTGNFQNIPYQKGFLEEGGKEKSPHQIVEDKLKETNEKLWANALYQMDFHASQGEDIITHALNPVPEELQEKFKSPFKSEDIKKLYGLYAKGEEKEAVTQIESSVSNLSESEQKNAKELLKKQLNQIEHGDIYLRQSYSDFREWFDKSYDAAKKSGDSEAVQRLEEFKNRVQSKLPEITKNPEKIEELGDTIKEGIHLLKSIDAPQIVTPLRTFAIDKASDTFSNSAFASYEKFGSTSPILSIENPPAGMGLSRSSEIKDLVEKSREKFAEKLMEKKGLSKDEAKKEAEKFIGATWDVGHINMIRKFGYGDKQLKQETAEIGKFVNKIHLSDNFGFEHTELPMGMGNVPIKDEMDILDEKIKGGAKNVKKIIEAQHWYQHFQSSPFTETLRAFGSPIYGMKMQPYWNQARSVGGGYFAGYGMNPDVHHSIYGAGFSNLPVELGGQMSGRNRLSGAPME